jgi:hypothetical protein
MQERAETENTDKDEGQCPSEQFFRQPTHMSLSFVLRRHRTAEQYMNYALKIHMCITLLNDKGLNRRLSSNLCCFTFHRPETMKDAKKSLWCIHIYSVNKPSGETGISILHTVLLNLGSVPNLMNPAYIFKPYFFISISL